MIMLELDEQIKVDSAVLTSPVSHFFLQINFTLTFLTNVLD